VEEYELPPKTGWRRSTRRWRCSPRRTTRRTSAARPALDVRFVAANTFLAMPPFMNRGARGRSCSARCWRARCSSGAAAVQGAVWMRAAAQAAKEQRGTTRGALQRRDPAPRRRPSGAREG
jgi:hypothetical protein